MGKIDTAKKTFTEFHKKVPNYTIISLKYMKNIYVKISIKTFLTFA